MSDERDKFEVNIESDGYGNGTHITINGVECTRIRHLKYEVGFDQLGLLTLVVEGEAFKLSGLAGLDVQTRDLGS